MADGWARNPFGVLRSVSCMARESVRWLDNHRQAEAGVFARGGLLGFAGGRWCFHCGNLGLGYQAAAPRGNSWETVKTVEKAFWHWHTPINRGVNEIRGAS